MRLVWLPTYLYIICQIALCQEEEDVSKEWAEQLDGKNIAGMDANSKSTNNFHWKQMYGQNFAYNFGGFGVLGYVAEREQKSGDADSKRAYATKPVVKRSEGSFYFNNGDFLLPPSVKNSKNGDDDQKKQDEGQEMSTDTKLRDEPIGEELPVYYLENMDSDKAKEVQGLEEMTQKWDQPSDVDTVGWID